MAKWYYSHNGKSVGPVSKTEIEEKYRRGFLTLYDTVKKEGDDYWRPLLEHSEIDRRSDQPSNLHKYVEVPSERPSGDSPQSSRKSSNKCWVLLKKVASEEGTRFVQDGPFSTKELSEMLAEGQVLFSDHIWKQGMTRWERVGERAEFGERRESSGPIAEAVGQENDPIDESKSGILRAPEKLEPLAANLAPEPEGDLVEDDFSSLERNVRQCFEQLAQATSRRLAGLKKRGQSSNPPIEPPAERIVPLPVGRGDESVVAVEEEYTQVFTRRRGDLVRYRRGSAILLLVVLALGGGSAYFYLNVDSHRDNGQITSVHRDGKVIRGGAPPELPKRTEKARVSLRLETRGNRRPVLLVHSNAVAGESVRVVVTGRAGKVLGTSSFYRSLTLRQKEGLVPKIDFERFKVPRGAISVEASLADAKATQDIVIGKNTKKFRQEMAEYAKKVSYARQREKGMLLRIAQRQTRWAERLLHGYKHRERSLSWQRFYRGWSAGVEEYRYDALRDFMGSTRDQHSFPGAWASLIKARKQLVKAAASLNKQVRSRRSTAQSRATQSIVRDFKRLQRSVGRLSVRK